MVRVVGKGVGEGVRDFEEGFGSLLRGKEILAFEGRHIFSFGARCVLLFFLWSGNEVVELLYGRRDKSFLEILLLYKSHPNPSSRHALLNPRPFTLQPTLPASTDTIPIPRPKLLVAPTAPTAQGHIPRIELVRRDAVVLCEFRAVVAALRLRVLGAVG